MGSAFNITNKSSAIKRIQLCAIERRGYNCPLMYEVRTLALSKRETLQPLLDPESPSDAMAAYYALEHPEDRLNLFGYFPEENGPRGFIAIAQTGMDLFRPLAIPHVADPDGMQALLERSLDPGRPVILHVPLEQRPWVEGIVDIRQVRVTELLRLDPAAFEPVINVLVVETKSPEESPRYQIQSQRSGSAAAGLNWQGRGCAEIYVDVDEVGRSRGFGKSVLAALAGRLLGEGRVALYRVEDADTASRNEAYQVGFRPTGIRHLVTQAVLYPPEED